MHNHECKGAFLMINNRSKSRFSTLKVYALSLKVRLSNFKVQPFNFKVQTSNRKVQPFNFKV